MHWLVDIALWGQHPDSAARVRNDWESYLDDYRSNHSRADTFVMMLRSSVSHIGWRASAREIPTTVPALLAITWIAICSSIFPFVDPVESTLADLHISFAAILFTLALAKKPWQIEHSKMLSFSLFLGGTGGVHLAFRFDGAGPVVVDTLMIIGHVVLAVGLTGAGVSGFLSKTAFGSSRVHMRIFSVGLAIIISANLLTTFTANTVILGALISALALAEIGLLSQIPRLVEISERPGGTERNAPSTRLA